MRGQEFVAAPHIRASRAGVRSIELCSTAPYNRPTVTSPSSRGEADGRAKASRSVASWYITVRPAIRGRALVWGSAAISDFIGEGLDGAVQRVETIAVFRPIQTRLRRYLSDNYEADGGWGFVRHKRSKLLEAQGVQDGEFPVIAVLEGEWQLVRIRQTATSSTAVRSGPATWDKGDEGAPGGS